jgi:hypothetical protein
MLAASSAQALEFRANGGITMTTSGVFSPIDSYDISGFLQAAGGVTYDDAPGPPSRSLHAQANSGADDVGLRAHAFAQVLKNEPQGGAFNSRLNAGSAAFAVYEDILITGGTGGPVSTSLNLLLEGSLLAGSFNTPLNSTQAHVSVLLAVLVDTGGGFTHIGGGGYSLTSTDGGAPVVLASGMLSGWSPLAGTVTTPQFIVPSDEVFRVEIQLQAAASVEGWYEESFILDANADFGSTLSFVTDGPVFNLGAGLTANSAEAGIEDNRFVAAPEPAGLACLLPALLLAGLRARKAS